MPFPLEWDPFVCRVFFSEGFLLDVGILLPRLSVFLFFHGSPVPLCNVQLAVSFS